MSNVLTPPAADSSLAGIPSSPIWRLSVEQYHAMIDREILHSGDPIELLEGLLVLKMTRNPPHRIALAHLRDLLQALINHEWHVETQEAITLETSEPEPDLTVIRGQVDDYPDRHPGPGDIGLVVEVADSSLAQDRGLKKRIYARAGIVEYWIVNLVDGQIEVFTDPASGAGQPDYQRRSVVLPGESVTFRLDETELGTVAVSNVLPS